MYEKYGTLNVEMSPFLENKYNLVFCICDCGRHTIKRLSHIKAGNIKSCGNKCTARKPFYNKTSKLKIGDKHKMLTIVGPVFFSRIKNKTMVQCICECKNFITIPIDYIRYNQVISCGCYKNKKLGNLRRKGTILNNGIKKCSSCLVNKTEKDFSKNVQNKDMLSNNCKRCCKNLMLKYRFNLTIDDYELMMKNQKYVCAICNKHHDNMQNYKSDTLCVDHCHSTNKVRGLLCSDCNKSLGLMKDSVIIVEKALEYLKYHNSKNPPLNE